MIKTQLIFSSFIQIPLENATSHQITPYWQHDEGTSNNSLDIQQKKARYLFICLILFFAIANIDKRFPVQDISQCKDYQVICHRQAQKQPQNLLNPIKTKFRYFLTKSDFCKSFLINWSAPEHSVPILKNLWFIEAHMSRMIIEEGSKDSVCLFL